MNLNSQLQKARREIMLHKCRSKLGMVGRLFEGNNELISDKFMEDFLELVPMNHDRKITLKYWPIQCKSL